MPFNEIISLILSLTIPCLIGHTILFLLFRRQIPFNPWVSLSLSFGLGLGAVTQLMLAVIVFCPPLTLFKITLMVLPASILLQATVVILVM